MSAQFRPNAWLNATSTRVPSVSAETGAVWYGSVIGLVVVVVWIVPLLGSIVLASLAVLSLKSTKSAVQAVTITWLLTSLNPAIYVGAPSGLRWLVLLTAVLGVFWRLGPRALARILHQYSGLLLFSGVALASAVVSSYPALAVSKLLGFLLGTLLIVGLFDRQHTIKSDWCTRWFMGLLLAVMILSAPLTATSLGYVRNAVGFQGILNHPQAMGIFLAPYLAALVLVVIRRGPTASSVLALLGTSTMLYLTGARTGALAAGMGVLVAVGVGLASTNPVARLGRYERHRSFTLIAVLATATSLLLLTGGTEAAREFIMKPGNAQTTRSISQEFEHSRGRTILASLSRFRESPLVGNGFGVPANVDRADEETVLGGVPISASIEAGFALTGLLEQVGVAGLLTFSLLLYQVVAPIWRGKTLVAVALAVAALSTNLGEATIASFGGMGLFMWLMVGWAMTFVVGSQPIAADRLRIPTRYYPSARI